MGRSQVVRKQRTKSEVPSKRRASSSSTRTAAGRVSALQSVTGPSSANKTKLVSAPTFVFWQNEAKFAKVFKDRDQSHPPTLPGVVFRFFWSNWRIETLAEVLVCLFTAK